MTIMDRGCFERGCACYDDRIDKDGVYVVEQAEPMTDTELINTNCRYTTPLMAEQAEQEPVAYFLDVKAGFSSKPLYEQVSDEYKNDADVFPLYAAPVRTKDLTDDEIWEALHDKGLMEGIRAVIAADREKNR